MDDTTERAPSPSAPSAGPTTARPPVDDDLSLQPPTGDPAPAAAAPDVQPPVGAGAQAPIAGPPTAPTAPTAGPARTATAGGPATPSAGPASADTAGGHAGWPASPAVAGAGGPGVEHPTAGPAGPGTRQPGPGPGLYVADPAGLLPPTRYDRWSATLHRPREGKVLGGVCAGMAAAWRLDPLAPRIAFLAATVLLFPAGALLYLARWLLMPAADDECPQATP